MTTPARALSPRVLAPRILAALAAACGFLAVAAGAFGAHGVSDPMTRSLLQTGGEYGMIHALAVFAALFVEAQFVEAQFVEGLGAPSSQRTARLAAWLFLVGGAVFSASLYALALSGVRWLGAITPLGGLAMLAGWIALGVAALQAPAAN